MDAIAVEAGVSQGGRVQFQIEHQLARGGVVRPVPALQLLSGNLLGSRKFFSRRRLSALLLGIEAAVVVGVEGAGQRFVWFPVREVLARNLRALTVRSLCWFWQSARPRFPGAGCVLGRKAEALLLRGAVLLPRAVAVHARGDLGPPFFVVRGRRRDGLDRIHGGFKRLG